MFEKILACLDGSRRAERLISWVQALAPSKVVLLRALDASDRRREREYLDELAARFSPAAEVRIVPGPPAAAILDAAQEIGADLIAITTRGGSRLVRRVFGGTTEKLIHASETPLLVVPPWTDAIAEAALHRIVVPVDGSALSERIFPLAVGLSKKVGGELIFAHVVSDPDASGETSGDTAARTRALADAARVNGARARSAILEEEPVQGILQILKERKAGLVLMSAHGHGSVRRAFVGSVASRLILQSPVPVLVLKFAALSKLS
jgi:nucleotide-binding universal stress UspA family protein